MGAGGSAAGKGAAAEAPAEAKAAEAGEKKIAEVAEQSKAFEVDKKAMAGRKGDRGFTVSMGKATVIDPDLLRGGKRAATLPSGGGRRGDFELSPEVQAEMKARMEKLEGRVRRGSIFLGAVREQDMQQKWEQDCELVVYGKLSTGQSPASEREIDFYPKSAKLADLLSKVGLVFSCTKGCKGVGDRSPNQDNFSVVRFNNKGGWEIICVMDGHGPAGHNVSHRSVQVLPYYLHNSDYFPDEMEKALEDAFQITQQDLLGHGIQEGYDVQASGTTAIVFVRKGADLYTAHTGDSRFVLGHEGDRTLQFETQDHKPNTESEQKRIEANGGEVREFRYDDEYGGDELVVHRVFIRGCDYPGLCMGRSLGDECVKAHGVTCIPEVNHVKLQLEKKPFLFAASDGVWEFIPSEWVIKTIVKKLGEDPPQKILAKICKESRRKWRQEEGDYCDDITGVLMLTSAIK
mmetsp:Transcript_4665/g.11282  ORF Transcript_4665/g.11282 Transcript_4665/m.11282 type:complete len:461 (-) Transcript_4665:205-1587(-)